MVTRTNYSLKWWWSSKEMPPKCPKHSDLVIRKYFAQMDPMGIYRWWLHFCCLFSSLLGENDPIWLMGWNNQLPSHNFHSWCAPIWNKKDWIGKLRSSHEMFLVNVGEYTTTLILLLMVQKSCTTFWMPQVRISSSQNSRSNSKTWNKPLPY